MSLIIPTLNDGTAHYTQQNQLDGEVFNFHFDFNSRDDCWYMSIHDIDDSPIKGCMSRRCITNWPLTIRSRDPRRPKGQLLVISVSGEPPGLYDLGEGGTAWLHYFEEAEVQS
jgi:hypothetical protein